jgi:accessory colonization factor AcfC
MLNLEKIKETNSPKTAFHEVIHPIVYDAFGMSNYKLIPIWNEIARTMGNVKGMERVFEHVKRYPVNEIATEGITETLTQISAGNIDLSSVPPSQANRFIELINKLFEALKIDFRINSINDFKEVAKKVKEAFDTSNAESLKGIIKGGKNIDNYYKNLKNRDINPEMVKKLEKLLQEKLKIEVEAGRLKQDNANKILKDNNIAAEESLTTKNKENEKVQSERTGDGAGRDIDRKTTPLEGTPSVPGINGPDEQLVAVAEKYAEENGIDLKRQSEYVKVDEERAKRIADAYEQMVDDPQNPRVKEAYQELIKQTMAQYQALVDAGYKFWFMDLNIPSNAEYAESPFNAIRDLRQNKTMGVFSTTDGYGDGGITESDIEGNPLLADTGLRWAVGGLDGQTKPVLANDLFRAVHDAFGHGLEGSGFRARGEENAWQAHVRLFTGPAIGAITSETRGQNSWLNFGPNGESNRTASIEDTIFAEQKIGLMPEWTWTEGRAGDMKTEQEAQPTAEQIGVKELMTADTKAPTTLNKVLDLLNKAEESIDKFGKETAGVNIALPLAKVIIKAI